MRRLFWVALGATAGVLVVRRLSRAADALTPEGLAARAGGVGERASRAVSEFLADISEAAAAREAELREALGVAGRADDERPAAPGGGALPGAPRATGGRG